MLSFALSVSCSTVLSVGILLYLDSKIDKIEKVTEILNEQLANSERVLQKRSVQDDLQSMTIVGQKSGIAVRGN